MSHRECETCIKRKTMFCPNSAECYDTENKPHYLDRITALEENFKLQARADKYKCRNDKAIETFENEIKSLKDRKRIIMKILTPENGYLKADVEYEIKKLERYLEILKGENNA